MKVYKGMMYRIIVEMSCGCESKQEFKDDLFKEVDGAPIFTPCDKHIKSKLQVEMLEVMLTEALEKEAMDAKNAAVLAIVRANGTEPQTATPVGEGSEKEIKIPLKVGNRASQRPNPVRPNNVNLSGAGRGIRRASGSSSPAATLANKKATSQAMDIDISGAPTVPEDPRITQVLVDDPDGGLLGDFENDSSQV